VFAAGLHPHLRPRSCDPPWRCIDDRRALRRNQKQMGLLVIDAPISTPPRMAGKAAAASAGRLRSARTRRPTPRRGFRREAGRCTATLIRVLGASTSPRPVRSVRHRRRAVAEDGDTAQPGRLDHDDARNRAIDRLRRESTRSERHLEAHRLHTDTWILTTIPNRRARRLRRCRS